MRTRAVLDAIAALKFLLTLDWKNFCAVLRARKAYRQMRADFECDRAENLRLAADGGKHIAERMQRSLLWLFYAKRCTTFSKLQAFWR